MLVLEEWQRAEKKREKNRSFFHGRLRGAHLYVRWPFISCHCLYIYYSFSCTRFPFAPSRLQGASSFFHCNQLSRIVHHATTRCRKGAQRGPKACRKPKVVRGGAFYILFYILKDLIATAEKYYTLPTFLSGTRLTDVPGHISQDSQVFPLSRNRIRWLQTEIK